MMLPICQDQLNSAGNQPRTQTRTRAGLALQIETAHACMAFAWVVTSTAPRFVFGSGETLRARGMPAHEYAAPSPR